MAVFTLLARTVNEIEVRILKMSAVKSYSKAFITDFIEIYKSLPCLWMIKSKEYSDRNKKNAAYEKLVAKLKEVEADANRDLMIKKINSLRSSYRKEKKKVYDSLKSGAGTEDVYTPTLWYYELFKFLDDQETPRWPGTNFEDSQESEDENDFESVINSPQEDWPPSQASVSNSELDVAPSTLTSSIASAPSRRPLNKKREREIDNVIAVVGKRLTEGRAEDKHDIFGRHIAEKLRSFPNDQRIYVEKIINDATFEAELGNLSRNCSIHIPRPYARETSISTYNNYGMQPSAPLTPHIPSCSTHLSIHNSIEKLPSSNGTSTQHFQQNVSDFLRSYTPI